MTGINIRKASPKDEGEIWSIIQQVIENGDTYVFAPNSTRSKMLTYWCGVDKHTYVATLKGKIVGTFVIKDNQPDLGSHIANASFMTAPSNRGQGIGRLMAEYALKEAKRLGYLAMQFNIVISSNFQAVQLWKKMGFEIIGEIPQAFRHQKLGLTNAYIMYRKL